MSPEAKRLKICGLLTMFAGLGVMIWAIVCAVSSPDLTDALQGAMGLGGTVVGAQGARLANVPSTAGGIVLPAILAFFAGAIFCVAGYFLVSPASVPQLAGIAIVAVLCLLVGLFARSIVEALKRK